ncbi:hypothetical protein HK57_00510 [Aspergillus ustus]|uniref:Uncharacterized protein n=1 Tax=Aspergillus ustus TaxID=40382 RepID=A0A0C1C3R9_ASPUT|nr:hypothetical protein HK57_00510 [Aspergillus ustus]
MVEVNIFLADMEDFEKMNEIYLEWFEEIKPYALTTMIWALLKIFIQLTYSFNRSVPPRKDDSNIPPPFPALLLNNGSKLLVKQDDGERHGGARLDDKLHTLQDQLHGHLDLIFSHSKESIDLVLVRNDGPVDFPHESPKAISDSECADLADSRTSRKPAPAIVAALE